MHTRENCFPDFRLLQITDSAFPLGSFAFSYGLESTAKLGLIKNIADFKKYLLNVLTQISCGELPFVTSCYKSEAGEDAIFVKIFRRIDAFVTIPCVRKGSITQGRSLLQAVKAVYPEHNFQEIIQLLQRLGLSPHYAPVFGIVARTIGLTHTETLSAYAYIGLRDQVSAAVRLGLLGPNEAQGMLRETLGHVQTHIDSVKDLGCHQAFKVAAALEIAQAHHPNLYSRLFQN